MIDKAIYLKADAILVHHGYFWKNEKPNIVGYKQRRIKKLLHNNINLLAYHLPLDGHKELGNNAQLAKMWGIKDSTPEKGLLRLGHLHKPMLIDDFICMIEQTLQRKPLHLDGGKTKIKTVAWCSGAAQHYIEKASEWGADVYISGEVSEQNCHLAKELGIHYLSAGHHATERYGVKALGEHLQQKFNLNVEFIDIQNPV